ncbi:hypothetical protein P4O66_005658 [Electrophorus voltai]|uniref:Uncharacterized protein n=1 Tax=Electrophorus voltai TaxID=2609070 RepID=A0AAD8ZJ73_9TELE|nr:hypothetical protein P4O66_005658 [Electrophorus voltai]
MITRLGYRNEYTSVQFMATLCVLLGGCKDYRVVVISASSACLGLLLILLLSVAVYKCKKRKETNENIFFNNKIYENFNFFSARPNAEPHNDSSVRTAGRPNLRRGPLTGEECIYEN